MLSFGKLRPDVKRLGPRRFFNIQHTNAQDIHNESTRVTRYWPRKLGYTPGNEGCNEDEDSAPDVVVSVEEDDQDVCDTGNNGETMDAQEQECVCVPNRGANKLKCLFRAAKFGMKEGALSGIFFGGSYGIYKWVEVNYLQKNRGDGGGGDGSRGRGGNENENENEHEEGGGQNDRNSQNNQNDQNGQNNSTTNNNLVFVTAFNSAIAMGVVCTLISCTKSLFYCN